MNHSKLILVGCISAFVAFTTSILGVAGTIIGSVISSVLYNMLSEALEKPVSEASLSRNVEWELAYVFPLVVIAIIQLLLIFALLAELGFLPYTFLNVYLSLQDLADNNLYRVLGLSLLVMSVYPFVLKPDIVKKAHGAIIAFIGLIFLARGFLDVQNKITNLYNLIFAHFDLPIALIALILLVFVIYKILISANESEKEFIHRKEARESDRIRNVHVHEKYPNHRVIRPNNNHDAPRQNYVRHKKPRRNDEVHFREHVDDHSSQTRINKSTNKIQYESNDLLDEYKK